MRLAELAVELFFPADEEIAGARPALDLDGAEAGLLAGEHGVVGRQRRPERRVKGRPDPVIVVVGGGRRPPRVPGPGPRLPREEKDLNLVPGVTGRGFACTPPPRAGPSPFPGTTGGPRIDPRTHPLPSAHVRFRLAT